MRPAKLAQLEQEIAQLEGRIKELEAFTPNNVIPLKEMMRRKVAQYSAIRAQGGDHRM